MIRAGRGADDRRLEARPSPQARELGVLQLGLSGGEPLVRADVEDLAAHAHALGLYTTLVTSGVGLTPASGREAARGRTRARPDFTPGLRPRERRSDRRHGAGPAKAGGRGHRAGARIRLFDQRRPAPRQPRSGRRDHRAGREPRRRPPRTGQHAVLRLGAREPERADADAGPGGRRRAMSPTRRCADIGAGCRSSMCCPITTSRIRSRATAGGADIIWS